MKNIFKNSNIKNEQDFKKCMSQIQTGYLDNENFLHMDVDAEFKDKYILQTPLNLLKTRRGVCWDQVELEREYFEGKAISCETYYISWYGKDNNPSHTFLIYQNDSSWCWFENYWKDYEGIHYYLTKERLLRDVMKKFAHALQVEDTMDYIAIFKYEKPKYGINFEEFTRHCEIKKVYIDSKNNNMEKLNIYNIKEGLA